MRFIKTIAIIIIAALLILFELDLDISITYSIVILVNIYLFNSMKGDIDFSLKMTRVNLIISIIWVLLLWSYLPSLIVSEWQLSDTDSEMFLIWRTSLSILLAIPVWKYWVIKPLYYWIKRGSDS